jgi:hypothetical protein
MAQSLQDADGLRFFVIPAQAGIQTCRMGFSPCGQSYSACGSKGLFGFSG